MTDLTPILDILFDQIRHGTDLERRRARIACIDFGEAAVPGLIALLQDDNAAVRHAAINTLGHLKSAAAADALRDRVYNETDIYARGQAIVSLVHCAKEAAVPDLLCLLDNDEVGTQPNDKRLCDYAVEQILDLTLPDLPMELETWAIAQMEATDAKDKVLALRILKSSATEQAIAVIEKALSDDQLVPFVYKHRYAPKTYQFYAMPFTRINTLAQEALATLKPISAYNWAVSQLQSGDYDQRRQAIIDLWFLNDERSIPLLFERLDDDETDVNGVSIAKIAHHTIKNWIHYRGLQPTPEQAALLAKAP